MTDEPREQLIILPTETTQPPSAGQYNDIIHTGHYINVIRKEANTWIVFDVENGKEKRLQNKDIIKLIRIELND